MRIIGFNAPKSFNIFLMGDDHLGTTLRHHKGWDQFVDMVNSKYDSIPAKHNFIVDHGDQIEGIMPDDPRFDPLVHDDAPLEQANAAARLREPIAKHYVALLTGNHLTKISGYGDLALHICREMGYPNIYGTWDCVVQWYDTKNRLMLKTYHMHGDGSIRSVADDLIRVESNLELSLKRKLKFKMGDCAIMTMGHTHKLIVRPPVSQLYPHTTRTKIRQQYTIEGKDPVNVNLTERYIHPDERYYVNTGSFLKLYSSMVTGDFSSYDKSKWPQVGYAERAGYDPHELGFAIARIRDRKIAGIDKIILD